MNVYDEAHSLAAAIKQSDEFKQYEDAQNLLKAHPDVDKMIKDFQGKSIEIQAKQMSGEQMTEEEMQSIQQLYSIIAMDPTASDYMQKEMRFSLMMKDVYEIIGEAIGQGDIFGGQKE